MKASTRALKASTLFLMAAGCKAGPNYKRPVVATPADYRGGTAPDISLSSTTAIPLGTQKWNTVFADPVLKALIAEALKNNYDVKIAADRVLEQQAQVGVPMGKRRPV